MRVELYVDTIKHSTRKMTSDTIRRSLVRAIGTLWVGLIPVLLFVDAII